MRHLVVATALVIGAMTAAPIARADSPDDDFLATLKQNHVEYADPASVVNLAKSICFAVRAQEPMWVVLQIVSSAGNHDSHDSGVIVGASVSNYCPEEMPVVQQYVDDHKDD
jgi:hypothetical protein